MPHILVRDAAPAITCRVIDRARPNPNHGVPFNERSFTMSIFASPRFLRNVLIADAASCVATGALQVAFTSPLADLMHLPAALLAETGWFLLVYAAVVGFVATRDPIPRALVWAFVAGNFAWAAGCAAMLVAPAFAPTQLGQAWMIAQAVVVVVLAELQWAGLRGAARVGWA
jgi:hypothetical protein